MASSDEPTIQGTVTARVGSEKSVLAVKLPDGAALEWGPGARVLLTLLRCEPVDPSRLPVGGDLSRAVVELENSSDEHRMVPGSYERPRGAECVCGGAWDRWTEQCVNQKGVTRRG